MSDWGRRQSWVKSPTTPWEKYKCSSQWASLKESALHLAGNRCQGNEECQQLRCKNKTHLELHHDNYPDIPEHDSLHNVRILCRECHEDFHRHNGKVGCIPHVILLKQQQEKLDAARKVLSKYGSILK